MLGSALAWASTSGHSQQQCDWSDDLPFLSAASPHIPACSIPTCSAYAAKQGDDLPYRDDLIEEQGV